MTEEMIEHHNRHGSQARKCQQELLVDLRGDLAIRHNELRLRLSQLAEERLCAADAGLDADHLYMSDLALELDGVRRAYAMAVILQLVALRAALDGPLRG